MKKGLKFLLLGTLACGAGLAGYLTWKKQKDEFENLPDNYGDEDDDDMISEDEFEQTDLPTPPLKNQSIDVEEFSEFSDEDPSDFNQDGFVTSEDESEELTEESEEEILKNLAKELPPVELDPVTEDDLEDPDFEDDLEEANTAEEKSKDQPEDEIPVNTESSDTSQDGPVTNVDELDDFLKNIQL